MRFAQAYWRKFPWQPRREERKHLMLEQIRAGIDKLEMPFKLMATMQYEAGLRSGFLFKLIADDIFSDQQDTYMVVKEKGGSQYEIYLMPRTAEMLLSFVANMLPEGRVFETNIRQYNRKLKQAGLNSSHWLRTSRGIHMKKAGIDPLVISRELWHHKRFDTSQIYFASLGVNSKKLMEEAGGL